jgi:undecaprenyl-diphosphatase
VTTADDAAPFGPAVARFDAAVEAAVDRWRGRKGFDLVFETASQLGDWSVIWHLAGAARGLTSDQAASEAVRLSATLGLESLIVNQGIKRLFGRRRPTLEGGLTERLRRPATSSFPSGHASAAFCAAVLLSDRHRGQAPFWYALAVVVAFSRVYVKLHHASDVVAGSVIGFVLGALARSLWTSPRH